MKLMDTLKTENNKDSKVRSLDEGVVRMEIAIADIVRDDDNRVIDETDEDFATLIDSIRVMRVLVALHVRRGADGKYRLVDGERRWRAAQRAGLLTVPCDVWPEHTTPRDLALAGVIINDQRQAHSCLAVARRLRAVKNQFAESHEQLAGRTGMALPRIKSYLNLFNASDRLLAFLEDASVPVRTAVELVRYEKAHGEAATRRILERHKDEPLTCRAIETLRKRDAMRRTTEAAKPDNAAGSRTSSLTARVDAAFRRDPEGARRELEAAIAKLGLRLVAAGASGLT
jgi:ParB family chromosome partitioning protein